MHALDFFVYSNVEHRNVAVACLNFHYKISHICAAIYETTAIEHDLFTQAIDHYNNIRYIHESFFTFQESG